MISSDAKKEGTGRCSVSWSYQDGILSVQKALQLLGVPLQRFRLHNGCLGTDHSRSGCSPGILIPLNIPEQDLPGTSRRHVLQTRILSTEQRQSCG